MPGLLYYVPEGTNTLGLEEVEAAGIGYAFEREPVARGVRGGPDGGTGAIVADSASVEAADVRYAANQQTWWRVPNGDVWIGRYGAVPVLPKYLARRTITNGHSIVLSDGQAWVIPAARDYAEEDGHIRWRCPLPTMVGIDDTGGWAAGQVHTAYGPLWKVAQAWLDVVAGAAENVEEAAGEAAATVTFDLSGQADAALLALALNYRVSRVEVAILGLFDDHTIHDVLMAVIDWPTLEALNKKKQADDSPPDDSPIDAGRPDSTQGTAPP